jgi:hypothetical protein
MKRMLTGVEATDIDADRHEKAEKKAAEAA